VSHHCGHLSDPRESGLLRQPLLGRAGGRHETPFPASFADDAVVVDVNRELRGLDAIMAWAGADIFGAHVHFDVLDVTERQERTIVRVKIDGTFDRTGLPDPLVMNHEFRIAEGKITELRIGF
jgi:SnoaL-like domain